MPGRRLDLIQAMSAGTKRDYIERVVSHDKAVDGEIASRFGQEYWDGPRHQGYGGYHYDGRWRPIAQQFVDLYGLGPHSRVLDVGCGKGYLLYEFTQVAPGIEVAGLDISQYGVENAKPEIRDRLVLGTAAHLPFADASFDCVVSLAALHNLGVGDLWSALTEVERVGRHGNTYIMVESYRDMREKVNLLYWQLTCKSFYSVEDWEWLFRQAGYSGDYGFIFFP